jgi:hypothetical protein
MIDFKFCPSRYGGRDFFPDAEKVDLRTGVFINVKKTRAAIGLHQEFA